METDVVSKPASARKVKFQEETGPQIEGIARKVVNIDGPRYLPRRGKVTNSNDGIMEKQDNMVISKTSDSGVHSSVVSYAATVQTGLAKSSMNFRFLESLDNQEGVDVVLPRESVKVVQEKLAFTLYG
ncbi:hypothetical protein QVD17_06839 [Tagetes erecta]|uniref:Uncharacterized protein n=1 Tax=Tagetes erecta TaxID=13708 RepID=A0AAD8PBK6_TARER|nr:hypothetical protein QVD17_06839 [Tagetes erecta]